MSKMFLRLVCMMLAAMMCFGTLAMAETPKQSELPLSTKGEKLTIYCAFSATQQTLYKSLDDHPVIKQIEAETGLDLEFVHPPVNDDGTFFNTTIASGEWPDLFYGDDFQLRYPGGVEGAIEDGVLMDVDELIKKYAPNFWAICEESDAGTGYIMNGIYGDGGHIVKLGSKFLAPFVDNRIHRGPVIRQDWLDKYNLAKPVTIEEYENVLRTFKANGVEVPLALPDVFNNSGFYDSQFLASAYGVTWRDFQAVDGKVNFCMLEDGYKQMLQKLNAWYQEGLIDRDSVSRKDADCETMFQNGRAGMVIYHNASTVTCLKVGAEFDPAYAISGLNFPRHNADDVLHVARIVHSLNNTSWQVSDTCKNPELAVKFVDYLHDDDTRLLTAWGLGNEESPTYTVLEDGSRKFSDDFMYNNPKYDFTTMRALHTLDTFQVMYDDQMERQQYYLPLHLEIWGAWATAYDDLHKIATLVSMTSDESREYTDIFNKVMNYASSEVYAYIFGEKSFDTYDDFIATLKKLGIERAIEIKQAAYDRYAARSAK